MSIRIEISPVFSRYVGNQLNVEVNGTTIGECLHDLARQHPDVNRVFLDRDGNLLRTYDIYINGESVYPLRMTTPVKDGDKLNLLMIINGG